MGNTMKTKRGKPVPGTRGVYRTETGFRVRVQAFDKRIGKYREVDKELKTATLDEARQFEIDSRSKFASTAPDEKPRLRFEKYATDLIEEKNRAGDFRPSTYRRYKRDLAFLVDRWGPYFLDAIVYDEVEAWRTDLAAMIKAGKRAPSTLQGPWKVFRYVMKAVARYTGKADPTVGVKGFDGIPWRTYTEEEPNALLPAEMLRFLTVAERDFPSWHAWTLLGFFTGRRPCEMKPLRRRGPEADIKWGSGILLIRQSYAEGLNDYTKTNRDLKIRLPQPIVDTLRRHVEGLTGAAAASDLLFPGRDGRFMNDFGHRRIVKVIAERAQIDKHITPRAMRRTYNDLIGRTGARAKVVKSISGHNTDKMIEKYSTAAMDEQHASLTKMLQLVEASGAEEGDKEAA